MVFILTPHGVTTDELVVAILRRFNKCVVTCTKEKIYLNLSRTMTADEMEKLLPCQASIKI